MSKPVRINQYVIDRVGDLAVSERRSLANMVEVLLLAALEERGATDGNGRVATAADASRSSSADELVRSVAPEDTTGGIVPAVPTGVHDVPMEKIAGLALRDGKCSADVAFGTKCKLCGKVH